MRTRVVTVGLAAAVLIAGLGGGHAGPWEDGMAAYNRGDYVPAIQIIGPLARQGNARAQAMLGKMYRRGQGVAHSTSRAYMWFGLAAARGDRDARRQLGEMSRLMSAEELSHARELAEACESSGYAVCPY